jgi:hypothetical protein
MVQVERYVNGTDAVFDEGQRLSRQDSGQRGQPLLTIEQQHLRQVTAGALLDGEAASWHLFGSLPNEDAPGRVPAIKRVQEVTGPSRRPYVPALELGEAQLSQFDHPHEVPYRDVGLLHGSSYRLDLGALAPPAAASTVHHSEKSIAH